MGKIYIRYKHDEGDNELFEIIKRAAIHAFAPFSEKTARRRLTIAFGSRYRICLSSDKDPLSADEGLNQPFSRASTSLLEVAEIIMEEDEGAIYYHELWTGINVDARKANSDVDWTDRDDALYKSFEKCLRESIACSDKYCMA